MQQFVSFRGHRPLDPHEGLALDSLGASRQPPDHLPFTARPHPPTPPRSEIPGSATAKTKVL
jgi:hypothetical protein